MLVSFHSTLKKPKLEIIDYAWQAWFKKDDMLLYLEDLNTK